MSTVASVVAGGGGDDALVVGGTPGGGADSLAVGATPGGGDDSLGGCGGLDGGEDSLGVVAGPLGVTCGCVESWVTGGCCCWTTAGPEPHPVTTRHTTAMRTRTIPGLELASTGAPFPRSARLSPGTVYVTILSARAPPGQRIAIGAMSAPLAAASRRV
jgi:hypothetical protein